MLQEVKPEPPSLIPGQLKLQKTGCAVQLQQARVRQHLHPGLNLLLMSWSRTRR